MRLTTRLPAAEVPAPLEEHLGRVVPLRIGNLAYTAVLEEVARDGDEVLATFDVPDADLRWEVLTATT